MVAIYFSGTGNTRHCAEALLRALDSTAEAVPMEDPAAEAAKLREIFGMVIESQRLHLRKG